MPVSAALSATPPMSPVSAAVLARHARRAALAPHARLALDHRLMNAVVDRRLADVRAVLAAGADPDCSSTHPQTGNALIAYAAYEGLFPIAQALVAAGAMLDRPGCPYCLPLHAALRHAHTDLALWLLTMGADPCATDLHGAHALHVAVMGRQHALIRALLARAPHLVHDATLAGNTALHLAVVLRDLVVVPLLLDAGADPLRRNTHGHTPLHDAVCLGNRFLSSSPDASAECLQQLLATGVSVATADGPSPTLLYTAIHSWSAACTVVLLQHGAVFTDAALRSLEQPGPQVDADGVPYPAPDPVMHALCTAVRDGTLPRDVLLPLLQSVRADIRSAAFCLVGAVPARPVSVPGRSGRPT